MSQALNMHTLAAAANRGASIPAYLRSGLAPGVVHLGLGAFHRAHQALVFDALLQAGDTRWGIHGVAMHNTQLADALARQDGLYAVQIASRNAIRWQIAGALLRTSVAARERAQVVAAIAAPATRWITLTVTEKAYGPELATLVVQGLALRQSAGLPGLTLASCDNLHNNGRILQALCMHAAQTDGTLAAWIAQCCTFPNSMVDRIVPASSPERQQAARDVLGLEDAGVLGTEAFTEWVIERRFADPGDARALAGAGVTVVEDVGPFEEAKLSLLNGSHSAMAYVGAVAGLAVVFDCVCAPVIRRFVHAMMTDEVAPHLHRPDWATYRDALLARFANPELRHSVHQIATDGSLKIPLRWVPSVLAQQRAGRGFEHLAFCAAAWIRYLRGANERGETFTVNDPMVAELQALARPGGVASAQALCTLPAVWGPVLGNDTAWRTAVTHWLKCIESQGILAAMHQLNEVHQP